MTFQKRITWVFIVSAVLLAVVLPWMVSAYWVRLLTSIFMFAVVAQAINLMMGYMGYVPFGQAVFFGLGAYTTGIAMAHGWPFLGALAIGTLGSGTLCVLFGLPVLRLRGHYFAVATIGLSGAIATIALNATELTGGAMGLSFPIIPKSPSVTNKFFYYSMLLLLILSSLVIFGLIKSRFGYAIRSIKADEEAAKTLGINTTWYKTLTWVISAIITSAAGSLYGWWMSYISTQDVFNVQIAVTAILAVLLGGTGTVIGPIIGAFILQLLSEITWSHFLEYHLGILGIMMILVILIIPQGIALSSKKFFHKILHKISKEEGLEQ